MLLLGFGGLSCSGLLPVFFFTAPVAASAAAVAAGFVCAVLCFLLVLFVSSFLSDIITIVFVLDLLFLKMGLARKFGFYYFRKKAKRPFLSSGVYNNCVKLIFKLIETFFAIEWCSQLME